MEIMISLRGEIKPNFLKNTKKKGKFFAYLKFLKKKIPISDLANLAFLKALVFSSNPSPFPPQGLKKTRRGHFVLEIGFDPPTSWALERISLGDTPNLPLFLCIKYMVLYQNHSCNFEPVWRQYHLIYYVFNRCIWCVGLDTWLKLHARFIVVILGLNRIVEGCKNKFNILCKLYKEDKRTNEISRSDHHTCKFYDYFYQWCHQTRTVIKHVTRSVNNYISVENNTTNIENDLHSNDTPTMTIIQNSVTKVNKKNFYDHCYGVFVKMAKNSSIMVNFFWENQWFIRNGRPTNI